MLLWSDSVITSRPGGLFYTFFVILRDGKLGRGRSGRGGRGGWCLIKVRDVTVKKISIKYFCIIKEKIA